VRERGKGTHVVEPGGEALVLLRLARVAGYGTDGLRASGRAHESVRVLAEVKERVRERERRTYRLEISPAASRRRSSRIAWRPPMTGL